MQGQLRRQMIAAKKTYELGLPGRSDTAEIAHVVAGVFGALCREDIEDSEPTDNELVLRRYGATLFSMIVEHAGSFLGSLEIET